MGLFDKLFGTYSERELKKIEKTVSQIEALADKYGKMTIDTKKSYLHTKYIEKSINYVNNKYI